MKLDDYDDMENERMVSTLVEFFDYRSGNEEKTYFNPKDDARNKDYSYKIKYCYDLLASPNLFYIPFSFERLRNILYFKYITLDGKTYYKKKDLSAGSEKLAIFYNIMKGTILNCEQITRAISHIYSLIDWNSKGDFSKEIIEKVNKRYLSEE